MKFLDRYKESLDEEQREILEYAINESYASQGLTRYALDKPWINSKSAKIMFGKSEDALYDHVEDGDLRTDIRDIKIVYCSLTLVEIHDMEAIIKEYEEEYSEYDDFELFKEAYDNGDFE